LLAVIVGVDVVMVVSVTVGVDVEMVVSFGVGGQLGNARGNS
jgi:hypothetical protein